MTDCVCVRVNLYLLVCVYQSISFNIFCTCYILWSFAATTLPCYTNFLSTIGSAYFPRENHVTCTRSYFKGPRIISRYQHKLDVSIPEISWNLTRASSHHCFVISLIKNHNVSTANTSLYREQQWRNYPQRRPYEICFPYRTHTFTHSQSWSWRRSSYVRKWQPVLVIFANGTFLARAPGIPKEEIYT